MSISTATITWLDTKLTYIAVAARANPIIKILVMKHNENKMYHIYNINTSPALPNTDQLDANPDQSYLELPAEVKLSLDVQFLTFTTFAGDVKLVRMPPIINPTRESDEPVNPTPVPVQAPPPGKGQPA